MTRCGLDGRLADFERGFGLRALAFFRTWPFATASKARRIEMGAHWFLRDTRTVGEWFHCHPLEAVAAVEFASRYPLQYIYEQGREEVAA